MLKCYCLKNKSAYLAQNAYAIFEANKICILKNIVFNVEIVEIQFTNCEKFNDVFQHAFYFII